MIDANDKRELVRSAPSADGEWTRLECAQLVQRLSARQPLTERYADLGEIGRGGMGRVLRVRDQDLHRDLAMKIMRDLGAPRLDEVHEEVTPQLVMSARFIEEAQVAAQLDHPGIVPVHDVGLDREGRLYFTMKLVRGRTLEKVLELAHKSLEGWSTTRVLNVLLRVCEAMSYAHERGVLHRDIKPANIMVGHHGEVYVMDWGLARLIGREPRAETKDTDSGDVYSARHGSPGHGSISPFVTEDGRILGTPAYMSPEQARGEPSAIRPTTDVYGVGALLYQALTGRAPYSQPGKHAENRATWVALQSKAPETITSVAPHTPAELVSICEKAMERSVGERYASMTELADDLRAYLEMRVVRAHGSGPLVELRKWVSRNKTMAGLLAVVVVLITVGSALLALAEQRRAKEALIRLDAHHAARLRDSVAQFSPLPVDQAARADFLLDAHKLVETLPNRTAQLARLEADSTAAGRAEWKQSAPDPQLENLILNARNWVSGYQQAVEQAQAIKPGANTSASSIQQAQDTVAILPKEIAWYESEVTRLEGERSPASVLTFRDREEQAVHDDMFRLAADLAYLEKEGIPFVEGLSARSHEVVRLTTESVDALSDWRVATASLADMGQCPAYRGLHLDPQVGLRPLRRDPASGLWEFWHLLSGNKPAVRPSGGYEMEADTAMVFVLVPGGDVSVGAQAASVDEPYFDPGTKDSESIRKARLDAYFISKYEMTQGQWLRLTGKNPSEWNSGTDPRTSRRISRSHPVEQVTWLEAQHEIVRWGLELPTEMQSENAARGGSRGAYATAADFSVLIGKVNFRDLRLRTALKETIPVGLVDDGFALHAPVGSFAPNDFGLYDAYGNVAEWCFDWYADSCEQTPPRLGDGEVQPVRFQDKVFRGGSFRSAEPELRASRRQKLRPDRGADDLGLRPARALDH